MTSAVALQGSAPQYIETRMQTSLTFLGIRRMYQRVLLSVPVKFSFFFAAFLNTLRTGSFKLFKLFKRPFTGFLTILTL